MTKTAPKHRKRTMVEYYTTKDIIIPAGTVLSPPPTDSTRWRNDYGYDVPVALGRDHCGYFSVNIAEGIEAGWVEIREKNGV